MAFEPATAFALVPEALHPAAVPLNVVPLLLLLVPLAIWPTVPVVVLVPLPVVGFFQPRQLLHNDSASELQLHKESSSKRMESSKLKRSISSGFHSLPPPPPPPPPPAAAFASAPAPAAAAAPPPAATAAAAAALLLLLLLLRPAAATAAPPAAPPAAASALLLLLPLRFASLKFGFKQSVSFSCSGN